MKYEGEFRNINNEVIQVVITTSKYSTETKELTFSDESPVTITQSSDGIFSPIKSRTCTISIVTDELYMDMYSGSSHGTSVVVNNLSTPECLFYGYLTPCEYNQGYTCVDEIELEAIDAISTLNDYIYTHQHYGEGSAVSIESLVKYLVSTAGYNGSIFVPLNGKKSLLSKNSDGYPFKYEYICDDAFFDNDGEAITCHEVLEAICKFYGVSCVPNGNDVYFIDYNVTTSNLETKNTFIDINHKIIPALNDSKTNYYEVGDANESYGALWIDEVNGVELDVNMDMQGKGVYIPFNYVYGKVITITGSDGTKARLDPDDDFDPIGEGGAITTFLLLNSMSYYYIEDNYGNKIKVDASGTDVLIRIKNNSSVNKVYDYEYSPIDLADYIKKDDYAGDDQNIEIDEVYNKATITTEVEEIEDIDIDAEDAMTTSTFKRTLGPSTYGNTYEVYERYYDFQRYYQYGGWGGHNNNNWQCYYALNSRFSSATMSDKLIDTFSNYSSDTTLYIDFPYFKSGLPFNVLPAQCCIPTQIFNYDTRNGKPAEADFDAMFTFFTQACWIYKYYKDVDTSTKYYTGDRVIQWTKTNCPFYKNTNNFALEWWYFQDEHMGGNNVYLDYVSDRYITLSPANDDEITYLCFKGNLMFNNKFTDDDTRYHVWQIDWSNNFCGGILYPLADVGVNATHTVGTRGSGDGDYNKGWATLKVRLSVGDKYWNGSSWTDTKSTFYINYHDDSVGGGKDETLSFNKWLKPICNHDYTSMINEEAFSIPIKKSDKLAGKLKIEFFMPKIPYDSQISDLSFYNLMKLDLDKIPPVIHFKDFSLSMVTVPSDTKQWLTKPIPKADAKTLKADDNDDIIYKTEISGNNVKEMDELDIAIGTWNELKKLSCGYILDKGDYDSTPYYHTSGFYNAVNDVTKRQELHLIDLYTNHHKTPKKIYNCEIKGYKNPYKVFTTSAITGKYVIDEQEFNVKSNVNSIKLVEY